MSSTYRTGTSRLANRVCNPLPASSILPRSFAVDRCITLHIRKTNGGVTVVVDVPLFVEGASMLFTEIASIVSAIDSRYGGIPPTTRPVLLNYVVRDFDPIILDTDLLMLLAYSTMPLVRLVQKWSRM